LNAIQIGVGGGADVVHVRAGVPVPRREGGIDGGVAVAGRAGEQVADVPVHGRRKRAPPRAGAGTVVQRDVERVRGGAGGGILEVGGEAAGGVRLHLRGERVALQRTRRHAVV